MDLRYDYVVFGYSRDYFRIMFKDAIDEMGVEYVNMKESSDVDATINGILDNVKVTQQEKTEVAYLETYYYFLPPLIILLLWDFVHFKRKV